MSDADLAVKMDKWADLSPDGPASDLHRAVAGHIRRLEAWKAEATTVMDDWLNVWKALGRPGVLGESLAHASEQEVASLVARIRELEAALRLIVEVDEVVDVVPELNRVRRIAREAIR